MLSMIFPHESLNSIGGGGLVPKSCLTLVTPWTLACQALCPWDSPGKNTGVGCHFLLKGVFPIQGSNPSPLHWQEDSWPLSPQNARISWWGWTIRFPIQPLLALVGIEPVFSLVFDWRRVVCCFFFPLTISVLPDCLLWARGGEQASVCLFFVCPRWHFCFADSFSSKLG